MKTPFFVSTNYNCFNIYINKLTKSSRWNYNNIIKKYNTVEYCKLNTVDGAMLLSKFVNIWETQIIRGNIAGNFGGLPIKNNTHFFACKLNNEYIMLQLVEYNINYVYCHMPMYNKQIYPELSKYAWFNLIKYIIENTNFIGIDMGGTCGKLEKHNCGGDTCNKHFKDVIKYRDKLTKYAYKYIYLTKDEKNIDIVKKLTIINNKIVELK